MTAGLYLHVPFCKSRCSYCDFATDVYRSNDAVERYVNALIAEVKRFDTGNSLVGDRQKQVAERKPKVDSIYFGGGTPSLLSAAQVHRIIETVCSVFDVSSCTEVTLEMNPATVTPAKLRDFSSAGVNRASFGVQTFDDRALKLLARGHNSEDARETFRMLRSTGFENISLDLIGGLPNQTLADWERNLDEALAMNPEHISLYLLEIHSGTPLAEQIRSKRQPLPDEDLAAEMYEMMLDKTSASGLLQYEISNFARAGRESLHNTKYWRCEPVFAFGVSAHSFDGTTRRANDRDTNRYVRLIESDESAIVEANTLSSAELASEFAFLNLRLTAGLELSDYKRRFGVDLLLVYEDDLNRLTELGLIEIKNDRLRLTRRGMVYSNEVFSIFV